MEEAGHEAWWRGVERAGGRVTGDRAGGQAGRAGSDERCRVERAVQGRLVGWAEHTGAHLAQLVG
jgi:hypothetical protein